MNFFGGFSDATERRRLWTAGILFSQLSGAVGFYWHAPFFAESNRKAVDKNHSSQEPPAASPTEKPHLLL
jgi:hypothetical protein